MMNQATEYIKEQLADLYPPQEIKGFTRIILEELSGLSFTQLLSCKDKKLSDTIFPEILKIVSRLKQHEPIQYILGKTAFYGFPFSVNKNVLIPRPETEELVEWIISEHQNKKNQLLDIGTGSGCIAVSLAKNLPEATVLGIDISSEALHVAKNNAKKNNVQVKWSTGDILSPSVKDLFQNKLDVIVSNPPYITEKEKESMLPNVLKYEPHSALFVPNDDPVLFYKHIADFGKELLYPSGNLYFEINTLYGQEICTMLTEKGYQNIIMKKDISGKDRMIKATL